MSHDAQIEREFRHPLAALQAQANDDRREAKKLIQYSEKMWDIYREMESLEFDSSEVGSAYEEALNGLEDVAGKLKASIERIMA